MAATLRRHTLFPPGDSQDDLAYAAEALHGHTRLVGPDGTEIKLPGEVFAALREVVEALSNGLAITIAPQTTQLTTQQAADMLNISRPTLVRLLEEGQIPFEMRGRHRRVRLTDLLDYQEHARVHRRTALNELAREAVEDGSYDAVDHFPRTR
ncbi:helix-turn-helix domain-containing protein [Saccharothrix violaceirubra]|uniref:Excisionase family DNA binding protein n=1 Tax=Saccharothrix violaceirubra TaxID=413306 RepID=A0A7W7TCV6_9PSEU|nr:helix-turn-helix domain-containing protein [Saccharothrix violaceirubra]MBB4969435.1 excisionase family DNA binding protein [Saccharothrix violaceirubra]